MSALSGDSAGVVAFIALVAGFTIYWTVESIGSNLRRARVAEQSAALKQQLADKGMTADDIVRVIEARPGGKTGDTDKA